MTESERGNEVYSSRLQSIDALRGFDMFWIIGGDTMARSLLVWFGFPELATQFKHVSWDGFRFYDMIFPLFLLLVGVVLPFSLSKYTAPSLEKRDHRAVYRRIATRTMLLIFLGWVGSGFLQFNFENFRWPGVLQRIGICYACCALAVLKLSVRQQALLFVGLLIGYWCLLLWVPAPGFKPYDLTKEGSLVGYVDRLLIPGKLYYKSGDNEGVLSTIPAIATALLGALAGQWLRSSQSPWKKVFGLYLAMAVCLATGYAWSLVFPLNKILWTSSFVLVAGGWSLGFLATFYGIIDVLGYRRWTFFFVVIGMNAITIYVVQQFVDFPKISQFFLGGFIRYFGLLCANVWETKQVEAAQKFVLFSGAVAIAWLMLWYLYRNKTFLKV